MDDDNKKPTPVWFVLLCVLFGCFAVFLPFRMNWGISVIIFDFALWGKRFLSDNWLICSGVFVVGLIIYIRRRNHQAILKEIEKDAKSNEEQGREK